MHILVLDSGSTDGTASLARSKGARVVERAFRGFVDARRFALGQVQTPWALMIDADERLDETLAASLLNASAEADGYEVRRTTYYCGRPLRMWRDERLLRLFRVGRARLEASPAAGGDAQVHERWICVGPVRELQGTLKHYSYPDTASYRKKYLRYTEMEAAGVRGSYRAALAQTVFAAARFCYLLCGRGAILDGPAGWRVAWYSALYPAVVQWKALRS